EPELRHGVELADVAGQLQERQQAGALARAKRVAQLLEVAGKETRWIAIALARLVGEPFGLGSGTADRGDERLLQLAQTGRGVFRCSPDREDHRQAGSFEPEAAEIVVRSRILESRLQGRIADQQGRLSLFAERHVL